MQAQHTADAVPAVIVDGTNVQVVSMASRTFFHDCGKRKQAPRTFRSVIRRDPCSFCGGPGGTIDHVVARANGGPDVWSNLTGACTSCNASKATDSLITYLLGNAGREN